MSSSATRRCSRKTNEKRVKRICFRVTTAPFREPRSLGSRVDSRRINLSCRKTPSSTKSRRAPTRAPPIILIGGTPVTSRRRRRELPVTLSLPPPPLLLLLLLCARFERARAIKIKTAPVVVRDDGDETNPVVLVPIFFFTPRRPAPRGPSGGTRGGRRCGSAGAAYAAP